MFFYKNRKALKNAKIDYPTLLRSRPELNGNARNLVFEAIDNGFNTVKARAMIAKFFAGKRDVLLSSEFLYTFAMGETLEEFVQIARNHGFRVHTILVLRRQDVWLESDFKQHVRADENWVGTFDELFEKRRSMRTMQYSYMTNRWADNSDHLSLHVINRSTPHDGIVREVAEFLGLEASKLANSAFNISMNISPPNHLIAAALEIKKALIARGADGKSIAKKLDVFFELYSETDKLSTLPSLLTTPQRAKILNWFEPINAEIAQQYFGRDTLFEPFDTIDFVSTPDFEQNTREIVESFLNSKHGQIGTIEKKLSLWKRKLKCKLAQF
jgi:hypothetical protein